jgi:uncharacterized protein GlcG (DUF336 family)
MSEHSINRRQALLGTAAGLAVAGALGGLGAANAQTPQAAVSGLSEEAIMNGLHAALSKAREISVPSVIAITDAHGTLLAYFRQESAFQLSTTFAQQKAYTAAIFGAPTADLGKNIGANPVVLAAMMKLDNVTLLGGGLPIIAGGVPIGGIASSGGSEEQDAEVAAAGLAAMGLS